MKKLLLIFGGILLLLVVGLAIFIATFDADRYRPLLVGRLQQSINKPVKLDHISLGWSNGIAFQLRGLAIYEDAQASDEPLVNVESVSAIVRVLPLLRKDIQVSSVLLSRPQIHLVRDAKGTINLFGLAAAASPAAASAKPVQVGQTPVSFQIASLRVDDGTLHWDDAMTRPPTSIWIKALNVNVNHIALGQPMDVDVKAAIGAEKSAFHFTGRITIPSDSQHGSAEQANLDIEHLLLEQILPKAAPDEPQLRGRLTLHVKGRLPTLDPTQIAQTVSGTGDFKLDQPILSNLNIIRAVFERFSMIPGLVQTLESRLPPEYQAKLALKDTVFSPIQLSVKLEAAALQFDNLDVLSDVFRLTGTGRIGLEGSTLIRCTLHIEPVLSAAIIKSVKELEALTDARGEMAIPLVIQGHAPQIAVLPDLNYVASRVIAKKAVNVIEGLLEGKSSGPGSQAEGATQKSPVEDLLGSALKRALKKHAPEETPTQ